MRTRFALIAAVAALAALPGCGTDDAVERDSKDAGQEIEKGVEDVDGDHVVLNSAEGRAWPRNLRRDPRVTIAVPNAQNPYEYAQIRGHVVAETQEGADEQINKLAKRYLGQDEYPFRQPGEQRVMFRIAPDKIVYSGT